VALRFGRASYHCLFKFPRPTLYVLGGLLLLILLGGLYFWQDDARRSVEREKREAGVKITVFYDEKVCPAGFPLHVFISNRSSVVVNSVSWTFIAFIPGRSSNISDYLSPGSSDVILKPETFNASCYAVPKLTSQMAEPSTLQWGITRKYVSFAE
jgi:hypothetical protein